MPGAGAWPGASSWPGLVFPPTVSPAIWFDGRQAAYTDLAGTLPAVTGNPLGRLVEASPLLSNWQPPTTGQRPRRDAVGARIDYAGTGGSQNLVHTSALNIDTTACTLAFSFTARDASQSPQNGLLRCSGFGLYCGSGQLAFTYNNASANWGPTGIPIFRKGQRVSVVVTVTSTGLKMFALQDGVLYQDALATAVTGSVTATQFTIGALAGADSGFYGTVNQAMVINRTLTDAEALSLLTWCDGQPAATAYPTTMPLFAVIGDSIARGNPGGAGYQVWAWMSLMNIRNTIPDCEMLNAAVGGSGTDINFYNPVIPYYSAQRARNVLVMASGTNDLANGNGSTYVINNLLNVYDVAVAAGWRPAIATVLDRTGGLSISQAAFDSQRATVNAAILASGRTFIDMTGVAGVSANGAASGANFVGDGIHPGPSGHALMEPVYRAQMLALAA